MAKLAFQSDRSVLFCYPNSQNSPVRVLLLQLHLQPHLTLMHTNHELHGLRKKLTKDHQDPYLDEQPFIIIIPPLFWFKHLKVLELHGMWNMISLEKSKRK